MFYCSCMLTFPAYSLHSLPSLSSLFPIYFIHFYLFPSHFLLSVNSFLSAMDINYVLIDHLVEVRTCNSFKKRFSVLALQSKRIPLIGDQGRCSGRKQHIYDHGEGGRYPLHTFRKVGVCLKSQYSPKRDRY